MLMSGMFSRRSASSAIAVMGGFAPASALTGFIVQY